MNNIRVSINCQKLSGVRIIRSNNHAGEPTNYVAIPMSNFFIPKDAPAAHLMVNLIPSPNALYSDFIVKPYIDPHTFEGMTREQRDEVPIIGKGVFQKQNNERHLAKEAEVEAMQDVDFTQSANAVNPPSEGRNTASDNGSNVAPF